MTSPVQTDTASVTSSGDHENLSMHSAVPEKVKETLMSQYIPPAAENTEMPGWCHALSFRSPDRY